MVEFFTSITDAGNAEEPHDKRPPRVLAVFFGGVGKLLHWQGFIVGYEIEMIGEAETLDACGKPPSDGAWVCDCKMVPNGMRDWPGGGMEYALEGGPWRPATEDEWKAYVADEWVWEELREGEPK